MCPKCQGGGTLTLRTTETVPCWQCSGTGDARENLRRAEARAAQDHADATRQLAIEDDRDN